MRGLRAVLLGLLYCLLLFGLAGAEAAARPAADRPGAAKARVPGRWISVSYRDLLDPATILRTGEKLVQALGNPARKAALQPLLEPYSSLLPYAVQMVFGPDPAPQKSVAERYAPGSARPGWAELLRGGRIHVTDDGKGHARVYLPGDEARLAYRRHYPAVRHPLAALLPSNGSPLLVEVFAYRNDYPAGELRLNLEPYRFRANRLPPDRAPLDLASLDRFFRQGGRLEGAELSPEEGLILYASRNPAPTLGGQPVTVADFAVAYRAAFHAGDNEAFVSLDPHRDPTLVTVSFGGLLEDTRIGAVVLEADKRFKTVSTGLDPNSFADIRPRVREKLPSFLSNPERAFRDFRPTPGASWMTTRYWFYPGSITVDSDSRGRFAVITRARFTADAERFEPELLSAGARARKAALPREIRENIKHLNENYDRYAEVFPEIGELTAVARLMAICSWLRRVKPAGIDLDALLSVELPPVRTPRELPRLMASQYLTAPGTGKPRAQPVGREARVEHLTPELDRTVEEVFRDPLGLARFLSLAAGKKERESSAFNAEAARIFEASRSRKARELIRTENDLQAFLLIAADPQRRLPERQGSAPEEGFRADVDRIRAIHAELASLRDPARSDGADTASRNTREQQLQAELQGIAARYHGAPASKGGGIWWTVGVTGGVSMEPRQFQVRKTPASPALERLQREARDAPTGWGQGAWIRSKPARDRASSGPPPVVATTKSPSALGAVPKRPTAVPAPRPGAASGTGFCEEVPEPAAPPPAPAMRKLAVPADPSGRGSLLGRITGDGKIVFTRTVP